MFKKIIIFSCFLISLQAYTQSKFLLIMGPSGAGKSTIIQHLKKMDIRFKYVTPLTTRPLRTYETDKIHVNIEEIENLKKAGKLLTVNHIYGIYYATPKDLIDCTLNKNEFPVLDWPVEKLDVMLNNYGKQLYIAYLVPDNIEELRYRLAQDERDKNGKRYQAGIKEMDNFNAGKYDHFLDLKLVNKKGCDKETAKLIYNNFMESMQN